MAHAMKCFIVAIIMMSLIKLSSGFVALRRQRTFSRAPVTTASLSRLFGGSRPRARRQSRQVDNNHVSELAWETFEFSNSPKWDARFEANVTIVAANEEELDQIRQEEAEKDVETAQELNAHAQAWQRMDPDVVRRALAVLRPYVKDERAQRIESVLKQRTRHARFLFENPANPSNVWACLRTLDSFGIQYIDVIINSAQYKGKAVLSQKRGMRTAMGSARWLTVQNHGSTAEAVRTLRDEQNCVIVASDLNPDSKDIRDIDWESLSKDKNGQDRSICLVMGSEAAGISEEMRNLADATFSLPMSGFAESFNLSVATAITLAHLSAASTHTDTGPLRPGDMCEQEYECLLLKGYLNSIPQKRMATALLKREGIELPMDPRSM